VSPGSGVGWRYEVEGGPAAGHRRDRCGGSGGGRARRQALRRAVHLARGRPVERRAVPRPPGHDERVLRRGDPRGGRARAAARTPWRRTDCANLCRRLVHSQHGTAGEAPGKVAGGREARVTGLARGHHSRVPPGARSIQGTGAQLRRHRRQSRDLRQSVPAHRPDARRHRLRIIPAHDRRHLWQAEQVTRAAGFPRSHPATSG
jgi:hypothetical protein